MSTSVWVDLALEDLFLDDRRLSRPLAGRALWDLDFLDVVDCD